MTRLRCGLYFKFLSVRGLRVPFYYRQYLEHDKKAGWPTTSEEALPDLLNHCKRHVPYYRNLLAGANPDSNPLATLQQLPILTKDIIRGERERLCADDLAARRWYFNTSGGSTGEPIRLVQDQAYADRSNALAIAFSAWLGHYPGDKEVWLWGSERDVLTGTVGLWARARNGLLRTTFVNAFRLTPQSMRAFAATLQRERPTFILAYAQALYEVAKFLTPEALQVPAPSAIVTSAGTLHGFMRETIERAFGCRVFNRYGSREVGLIACERPEHRGLWCPPVSVYIEIVDDNGQPVPPGVDGNILVTSLLNRAMPLVRYRIGDRGALLPGLQRGGQALAHVLGRNVDAFRRRDGTIIDGEYFTHLLYFRDWVQKFQFVQRDFDDVLLRVVTANADKTALLPELVHVEQSLRTALGSDARLSIEWVDDIPPAPSGKYRYTISEVAAC
jgi:phenylacetate-CoA ligase